MKAVLTRVSSADVTVDGEVIGSISAPDTGGILALVGVARADVSPEASEKEAAAKVSKMARKIAELRILDGEKSVSDVDAPVLVVSQFTLYGRTAKGRRPSWSDAAPSETAEPLVQRVISDLRDRGITVETGQFGADMKVSSVNEGPFTVLVEV